MNPANIYRIAENLVNGNTTVAKKQAKKISFNSLQTGLTTLTGWSMKHGTAAAIYLKDPTPETWQRYCDESAADKIN